MNRDGRMVALLLAAIALFVSLAAVVLVASGNGASDRPEPGRGLDDRVARLEQRLASVDRSLRELASAQEESSRALATAMAAAGAVAMRRSDADSSNEASTPAGGPVGDSVTKSSAGEVEFSLDEALAELLDPGVSRDRSDELWARLREFGLLDAAVAAIEEATRNDPSDPDRHLALGNAYLARLDSAVSGPEKGAWAEKADESFDQALALDENHWEARFTKAMSLSFWPPIFGKQDEAIQQFERLMTQQEQYAAAEPGYRQTYVYLGNLLEQQGRVDEAREVFARGYSSFPDDDELRRRAGR